MRILYFDIDSLRHDHLGCSGYHRPTSPNIDCVAKLGTQFDKVYVSDAPCLPSRTSLFGGRFGIHNGVVNHGGTAADPFVQGISRGFGSKLGATSWMACLKRLGLKTATVSPFGERHSAWHWYANFNEIFNSGKCGYDIADDVEPDVLRWLDYNGAGDNWFLHVNYWDPHTPYRTPTAYGNPFAELPTPDWLTEELREKHWRGGGPHSAQEVLGWGANNPEAPGKTQQLPLQPEIMDSMDKVRMMFDGYDIGIRYADDSIGRILNRLADLNLLDDTAILISADHGEALGEFNIYGDHMLADEPTNHVPCILRWPGAAPGRTDSAPHHPNDLAATIVELLGGSVPECWDGRSFAEAFRTGQEEGRPYLVLSQGAWSCQRSVRFEDFLYIRSYHDGHHAFPDEMLFDIARDPHQQQDLAAAQPAKMDQARALLAIWRDEMMLKATHNVDPMTTVLLEGGPLHCRGELAKYLARLEATGRSEFKSKLLASPTTRRVQSQG